MKKGGGDLKSLSQHYSRRISPAAKLRPHRESERRRQPKGRLLPHGHLGVRIRKHDEEEGGEEETRNQKPGMLLPAATTASLPAAAAAASSHQQGSDVDPKKTNLERRAKGDAKKNRTDDGDGGLNRIRYVQCIIPSRESTFDEKVDDKSASSVHPSEMRMSAFTSVLSEAFPGETHEK
eukprot:CAMPEP_0185262992 /NCGR_PEP_ID=MMETSP1359-20130426/10996_1 /TAXON_ID=552665 /ORGANISM="Bigelowiella longifila, Strain CCMP242" /LENGTH=178 /DNA_ID=CAMNT_0027850075 /DNA_START=111 /DNA_END=647 /DNA_ORIENTATION=+